MFFPGTYGPGREIYHVAARRGPVHLVLLVMAEVWAADPTGYIRECAKANIQRFAWSFGSVATRKMNPNAYIELHYPVNVDYRALVVGDAGTYELRRGFFMENPAAIYPTWNYGVDDFEHLQDLMETPALEMTPRQLRMTYGPGLGPRPGQEHRVVITGIPDTRTIHGRSVLSVLRGMAQDNPEAIVHIHATESFSILFGMGFAGGSFYARRRAQGGYVYLGSGKYIHWTDARENQQWVNLVGMTCKELEVPANRTIMNLRSAMWAADNYAKNVKFRSRAGTGIDLSTPTKRYRRRSTGSRMHGDKFLCGACSLASTCKYYRDQGVCSLPDSESSSLARYFRTRNADQIIEGLSQLLAEQVKRAELGMSLESGQDGMDPETTKIINSVLDHGVKLAKLINPALAGGGAKIQINNTVAGAVGATSMTPQMFVAQVIASLEAQGIARHEIDDEMIHSFLSGRQPQVKSIEVTST